MVLSWGLGGYGGSRARGLFIKGGLVETGKQKKGGWGLTRAERGSGDGQVSSIPQGTDCYAKQNEFSLQEAGANLSGFSSSSTPFQD